MDMKDFSVCGFAHDLGGKLFVFRKFSSLIFESFPVMYSTCYVAAQVQFNNSETGKRKVNISIMDRFEDLVIHEIKGDVEVNVPQRQSNVVLNLVVSVGGLRFERSGEYLVNLNIDEQIVGSLPLTIIGYPNKN